MKKIVALVGMPGAGKTTVAKFLARRGLAYLRFGQLVLDEALRRGAVNEETERKIRNELRAKHGMGAMAKLNLDNIEKLLKRSAVVIDDLYSWAEYLILKKKYGRRLVVAAVLACPKTRYARLKKRHYDPDKDRQALHRPLSLREAKARDVSQIEELDQGGPLALADFYLVNEGTLKKLFKNAKRLIWRP